MLLPLALLLFLAGNAAWINVVGMVAVLFNPFFINLVVSGPHSYAG